MIILIIEHISKESFESFEEAAVAPIPSPKINKAIIMVIIVFGLIITSPIFKALNFIDFI